MKRAVSICTTVSCLSFSAPKQLNFVDFARGMIDDAFGSLDSMIAQDSMDIETDADLHLDDVVDKNGRRTSMQREQSCAART
jgi:hypothetical protein